MLQVIIIGGGLAGLSSARVLREHHAVTVLERSPGGHEQAAAIQLAPGAVKVVQQLGLDKRRAGSLTGAYWRTLGRQGNVLNEADMSAVSRKAGADWYWQHRADLWDELLRLATAPSQELGIQGEPAKIIWGARVEGVDVDRGIVRLADGEELQGDLIIGADGIKSMVRPLVVGEDSFQFARPSGLSAFRFTLPAAAVTEAVGQWPVLNRKEPATGDIHLAQDDSHRCVVFYPCRNFEILNAVCIAPDSALRVETTESWSSKCSREDLLHAFADYGSQCRTILQMADNIKLWQLRDQDPLPTYIRGRTVLIGDAAHAMTPHQGQGGTQSIEDAEGFRLFTLADIDRSSVPAVLQDFDRVRRVRASRIQNSTRESHDRRTPEDVFRNVVYSWTYPGIEECLARLDAGKEMIEVS